MLEKKTIEIKVSWGETIQCLVIGILLFVLLVSGIIWLLYPFFTAENIWDKISVSILTVVVGVIGLPFLVYLVGMFSLMLIGVGVINSLKLKRYDGLIYKLNEQGLTYFENNKPKFSKWSEISDVGCFKQNDDKIKVLYKYQIKFTDGTVHDFDLRGKYPTKKFKDTIEDYWMFYNC